MEKFLRAVGQRTSPPIRVMPSAEARAAMASMARYETRAPKGIFRYKSHEEANRDRDGWLTAAMVYEREHG